MHPRKPKPIAPATTAQSPVPLEQRREKLKAGLAVNQMSGHGEGMEAVTQRLKAFLQFIAVKLIDDPSQAVLKVAALGPKKVRFKLVLAGPDVAILIGRNGFTASAIRNVLKSVGEKEGVHVSLQIHSQEEEAEMLARGDGN